MESTEGFSKGWGSRFYLKKKKKHWKGVIHLAQSSEFSYMLNLIHNSSQDKICTNMSHILIKIYELVQCIHELFIVLSIRYHPESCLWNGWDGAVCWHCSNSKTRHSYHGNMTWQLVALTDLITRVWTWWYVVLTTFSCQASLLSPQWKLLRDLNCTLLTQK